MARRGVDVFEAYDVLFVRGLSGCLRCLVRLNGWIPELLLPVASRVDGKPARQSALHAFRGQYYDMMILVVR